MQNLSCPKCEFKRNPGAVECPRCGIIFEKYEQIQKRKAQEAKDEKAKQEEAKQEDVEDIKKRTQQQKASTPPQKEDDTRSYKKHRRLINPVIVSSIIVAFVISFIGYKTYLKIDADTAQAEFSTFIKSVSIKMITLAIDSESVVDEINREWREAIYSDYNKRDFNEAIIEVRTKRFNTISSIKKLSEDIAQSIKNITPPPIMESDYKRLKELYLLFNKYADMAISPSGSLQTYSSQNNELSVEIKSAIKELEMMK